MALGLGIKCESLDSGGSGKDIRPPSLNLDGVDDAVYGAAGDSEFDSWDDFTIIFWIENNKFGYSPNGDTISLGSAGTNKGGFRYLNYAQTYYFILEDGSGGGGTASISLANALNHPKGDITRFMVGAKGDASANTITCFGWTEVKGFEESTTSVTYANWGDVGSNVSLVIGGQDSDAGTGLAITEDWSGGGIHNVGMWKSVLSTANITTIWNNGKPKRSAYEGLSPRHYWEMGADDARLGYPKDLGSTAKNLSVNGAPRFQKLQDLNP